MRYQANGTPPSARAFTLIEVLVVIAIIGILAALVVNTFGNARVDANNAAAKNDISEGGTSVELFRNDASSSGVISSLNGSVDTLSNIGGSLSSIFTGTQQTSGSSYSYGTRFVKAPGGTYQYTYTVPQYPSGPQRELVGASIGAAYSYALCSTIFSSSTGFFGGRTTNYYCIKDGSVSISTYSPNQSGLKFNGINSYIAFDSSTGDSTLSPFIFDQNTSFTVEFWSYLYGNSSTGRNVMVMDKGTSFYGGSGFWIEASNAGIFRVILGDTSDAYGNNNRIVLSNSSAATPNDWHHIAMVVDRANGGSVSLFIDGKSAASASLILTTSQLPLATVSPSHMLNFGAKDGGLVQSGGIDEIRISKVARYSGPFTPSRHFGDDSNTATLGLWHLDEGTGTTIADTSGNHINGTLTGTTLPQWITGL